MLKILLQMSRPIIKKYFADLLEQHYNVVNDRQSLFQTKEYISEIMDECIKEHIKKYNL